MKTGVVTFLFLFIVFCGFGITGSAQDITGIWRGYFVSDGMEQYRFEVQIEQNKASRITGVSYSYLDTKFYGKASLTGFFNKKAKTALLQEIKTIELRMSGSSVACIMKFMLNYTTSGKEQFLEGTFTSMYEKSGAQNGVKQGGDCGGGRMFLRKVITSDFYVEPFLRDNPVVKNKTPEPTDKIIKPTPKPPVTNKTNTAKTPATPPTTKPATKTPPVKEPAPKPVPPPVIVPEQPKKEVEKPVIINPPPVTTRNRENNLIQTLTVQNEEITVRLYDNGEVDDDTISVYQNNQQVLSKKRLSAAPITLTLKIDENNPDQTLVMVAENMGRFPPNTSLMIVYDGDKRYEVRITSTETKNAMVRFRYQKK